ncbi:MAG TPA: cytochrome c [Acidimicrobiia bacterium]|nr:cytochrome c [Acidimicrobiia bacterium]
MDMGSAVLALAILAFIGWLTYAVTRGPARPTREAPPPNLEPYMTDDGLESKRLNRVLGAALVSTAVLAIIMPLYYLNETDRQAAAEHRFGDIAIERGHHWFEEFQCIDCHGPGGSGGAASYIEPRSGMATSWAAPALDDIFLRYSVDEIRYWITFGRPGTPMPAWGVEGGGPLTYQQVDELIALIETLQIGAQAAFDAVDSRVRFELTRLDGADDTVDAAIAAKQAEIDSILAAPDLYAQVVDMPEELVAILSADGTCTAASAEIVSLPCGAAGTDTDRDGLADAAETALTGFLERLLAVVPASPAANDLARLVFDPADAFSNTDSEGRPLRDLAAADEMILHVDQVVRDLRLATQNGERLLAAAEANLAFLIEAREARRYAVDFDTLAADAFDGNLDDARRAVGLYNAYCARCHTSGFSAGIAFTQEPGSGAMGPSLRGGRSLIQFPNLADHVAFLVSGSDELVPYGINGLGSGRMPGFGTFLSEQDLTLIARYERSMP